MLATTIDHHPHIYPQLTLRGCQRLLRNLNYMLSVKTKPGVNNFTIIMFTITANRLSHLHEEMDIWFSSLHWLKMELVIILPIFAVMDCVFSCGFYFHFLYHSLLYIHLLIIFTGNYLYLHNRSWVYAELSSPYVIIRWEFCATQLTCASNMCVFVAMEFVTWLFH